MLYQGPVRATYDALDGNSVHFYRNACIDAAGTTPGGYFYDLERALRDARRLILIADWSFHPTVCLSRDLRRVKNVDGDNCYQNEDTIGALLIDLARANKDLLIAVLTWNHTNVGSADSINDNGVEWLDRLAGGKRPPNLLWRMTSRSANFMSHHQKFVVVDTPVDATKPESSYRTMKAFFGGIDITKGRFDCSDHPSVPRTGSFLPYVIPTRIAWKASGQKKAYVDEWYNAEFYGIDERDSASASIDLPRETWHDVHGVITGPTAWDVMREFVGRWNIKASVLSGGDTSDADTAQVIGRYDDLISDGNFKVNAPMPDAGWKARVLRSIERSEWGQPTTPTKVRGAAMSKFMWTLADSFELSIQDAYIDTILKAERFVYIETQYFIGSGDKWEPGSNNIANGIPEAIVKRVLERMAQNKDFHVYLVMPMYPEGAPTDRVPIWQRYYEYRSMRWMAEQVQQAARARQMDWSRYLTFAFPVRWEHLSSSLSTSGSRQDKVRDNRRYMVYVHSKWMVVDDTVAILGSANLNERSLAGNRDTEICIHLEATTSAARDQLKNFRKRLWSEHLVQTPTTNSFNKLLSSFNLKLPSRDTALPEWDAPESMGCVSSFTATTFRNYLYFRRGRRLIENAAGASPGAFVQNGQLACFPFCFVNSSLAPDASSGTFGTMDTDKLPSPLPGDQLLLGSDPSEIAQILKRTVADVDTCLPDSDVSTPAAARNSPWQWTSQKPTVPAGGGLAE